MCARRGVGIQIQCANMYEVFSNNHSLGAMGMFPRRVSKASLGMGVGDASEGFPRGVQGSAWHT